MAQVLNFISWIKAFVVRDTELIQTNVKINL